MSSSSATVCGVTEWPVSLSQPVYEGTGSTQLFSFSLAWSPPATIAVVNVLPLGPRVPMDGVAAWEELSLDSGNFHLRTICLVLGYRFCCPNGSEKLHDKTVS